MEDREIYNKKLIELLESPFDRMMLEFLINDDPVNLSEKKVIGDAINALFMDQVLDTRPAPTDDASLFAILGVLDFQQDCEGLTKEQKIYRKCLIAKVYDLVVPLCKTNTESPSLAAWLEKILYLKDMFPRDIAEWWDRLPNKERRNPKESWRKGPAAHAKDN